MKNIFKLLGITAIALVIGILSIGCDVEPPDETTSVSALAVPTNITITVTQRTMVVTWDEVANASGYEITTDSENCGSGKKIINTKDITAITNNPASTSNGANALKNDKTNGAVEILAKNKIQITLMPAKDADNNNIDTKPMATAVTAKVKSLGTTISGNGYSDSDYSAVVRKELGGM